MKPTLAVPALLLFSAPVASGQHPWQKPLLRERDDVRRILGGSKRKEPSRDLRVVWVWGFDKNHAPGFHEYVKVKDLFGGLLARVPRVTVESAKQYPSKKQWEKADLVVFYVQLETIKPPQFALMDAFLGRGGGMVAIHAALIQQPTGDELAARFGLAWNRNVTRWGVLPIPSRVDSKRAHSIFDGFPDSLKLVDEHYWGLAGRLDEITVLATSQAGPAKGSTAPP